MIFLGPVKVVLLGWLVSVGWFRLCCVLCGCVVTVVI